jgi:fructose-1,6-bisphosphatase/inositol monophosphatase family enzyme
MSESGLGNINGHVVGRLLKETVRRATVAIRNERSVFETQSKMGYSGSMDDVFTSADIKAQDIYKRLFDECFPLCGIIGEEGLRKEPHEGVDAYFTVDPLDGTKAYTRRQSHGVATMVALVRGGVVISAYIGDINTEEVYGYRPGSSTVHRITRLDTFETLSREAGDGLDKYALLRNPTESYSVNVRKILMQFKSHYVFGSSIGTWMAQLWKREVSAAFLEPGNETPWDSTPVIGISQKLGYVFLKPQNGTWVEFDPIITKVVYERKHETLVVHRDDLPLLSL